MRHSIFSAVDGPAGYIAGTKNKKLAKSVDGGALIRGTIARRFAPPSHGLLRGIMLYSCSLLLYSWLFFGL